VRNLLHRLSPFSPVRRLHKLFGTIADDWEEAGVAQGSYIDAFATSRQIANMLLDYRSTLQPLEAFAKSEGCDLGCWLGFSTVILAATGPRLVHGVDIEPKFIDIAEDYRAAHGLEGVEYSAMIDRVVPLADGQVDWVVINHVLCNAVLGTFHDTLCEAFRILGPGGLLVISDGNNPHCPTVMTRLRENWRQREIGNGTPERPDGPNHRARVRIIAQALPDLDADRRARLARETCYMDRAAIIAAGRRLLEDGTWPDRPFRADGSQPTISPGRSVPNGAVTDPLSLVRELSEIGFEAIEVTCEPERRNLDERTLQRQLETSADFYIFAQRPG
jgi:SAM-dependent methyltransferase